MHDNVAVVEQYPARRPALDILGLLTERSELVLNLLGERLDVGGRRTRSDYEIIGDTG